MSSREPLRGAPARRRPATCCITATAWTSRGRFWPRPSSRHIPDQLAIEADLRRLVEEGLDLPDADLAHLCERGVRNHDPCISCAAHFLRLDPQRA